MLKPRTTSKSPLTLLLIIACLVISTLVMISNYFFRPGLEQHLKNRITSKLHSYKITNARVKVEGRDVVLDGIALNDKQVRTVEAEINRSVYGIGQIENNLSIKNNHEKFNLIKNQAIE